MNRNKCALCESNVADKKNTHYLTDSVIRLALNQDGKHIRETGIYIESNTNSPLVNFNYQRGASEERIKGILGRKPTDEENNNNVIKENPFAVDYTFCSSCENEIFGKIELDFTQKILPKLRNKVNLKNETEVDFKETKIIKLFFLLQVWRSSVCTDVLQIENNVKNELQRIILNSPKVSGSELDKYPLSVSFLITENDKINFTENLVALWDEKSPSIIFMNDFIIQFFSSTDHVKYNEFHGLNTQSTFQSFVNTTNSSFKFQILSNCQRINILNGFYYEPKGKQIRTIIDETFSLFWKLSFKEAPSQEISNEFKRYLDNSKPLEIVTQEGIKSIINKFIIKKQNEKK